MNEQAAVDNLKWVFDNWQLIVIGFLCLEKIVKLTPTKWDDIILDMVLKPIFSNLKDFRRKK